LLTLLLSLVQESAELLAIPRPLPGHLPLVPCPRALAPELPLIPGKADLWLTGFDGYPLDDLVFSRWRRRRGKAASVSVEIKRTVVLFLTT
jgi:hypothetical protein